MQGDLFIQPHENSNNQPIDVSTIGIDFGNSSTNKQALTRTSEFINSIPKGRYMIHPTGCVHRLAHYKDRTDFPYVINVESGRVVTVNFSRDQYPCVDLRNKFNKKTIYIHRIIGMAFLHNPLPLDRTIIHHINEDKHDYSLDNLEWVTPSYNLKQVTPANKNQVKYIPSLTI